MDRVLFVDFDGTLTLDRYWRSAPRDIHTDIQNLLFGDDRKMVNDWMRGKYTAEDINLYVANRLDVPYRDIWDIFKNDCEHMDVSPATLELIKELGAQYRTVLITGNMDSFTRFTAPALQLDMYFDHISNSYYEEIHKTDERGRLFKDWLYRLNVPFEASVLIDDQDACCELFSALGGKTCQTSSPEQTHKILQSLQ